MIKDENDSIYKFMSGLPAYRVAQGNGCEGIYSQRGRWWYFDGQTKSIQIPVVCHLKEKELLTIGRKMFEMRFKCRCPQERTDGLDPCGKGLRDQRSNGIYCKCGHDLDCCINAAYFCERGRDCSIHYSKLNQDIKH